MNRYRILELIGEGTYGKVFKAQEKETGAVVAIKRFKQNEDEDNHVRKTMHREIKVLTDYPDDNIVALREHFRENGKLYLIFDFIDRNLLEELQQAASQSVTKKSNKSNASNQNSRATSRQDQQENQEQQSAGLPSDRIKNIIYQILKATASLHNNKILHRDIKPENLLLSKNGVIKLCDFGFARGIRDDPRFTYTDYVSTRWYRAPELLVGDAQYSCSIDIWAVGCIFAEIFNGLPLFPGDSDLHTLQLIMETITADDVKREATLQELTKKQRVAFKMNSMFEGVKVPTAASALAAPEHVEEVCLTALLKGINSLELDFLRKCLIIDGSQRATAEELLKHEYFNQEFIDQFNKDIVNMREQDKIFAEELAKTELRTKDNRSEIPLAELLINSSDDEQEVEEYDEDDDSDNTSQRDRSLPEHRIVKKAHQVYQKDGSTQNGADEKNDEDTDDIVGRNAEIGQHLLLVEKSAVNTIRDPENNSHKLSSKQADEMSIELPKDLQKVEGDSGADSSNAPGPFQGQGQQQDDTIVKLEKTQTQSQQNGTSFQSIPKGSSTERNDQTEDAIKEVFDNIQEANKMVVQDVDQQEDQDEQQNDLQINDITITDPHVRLQPNDQEDIQPSDLKNLKPKQIQESQIGSDVLDQDQMLEVPELQIDKPDSSEQHQSQQMAGINRLSEVTLLKDGIHEEVNESGSSQNQNSKPNSNANSAKRLIQIVETEGKSLETQVINDSDRNKKDLTTPPRSRTQLDSLTQNQRKMMNQERSNQVSSTFAAANSPQSLPQNSQQPVHSRQQVQVMNTLSSTSNQTNNLLMLNNPTTLNQAGTAIISASIHSPQLSKPTKLANQLYNPANHNANQSFLAIQKQSSEQSFSHSNQQSQSQSPQKIAKVNITFAKRQSNGAVVGSNHPNFFQAEQTQYSESQKNNQARSGVNNNSIQQPSQQSSMASHLKQYHPQLMMQQQQQIAPNPNASIAQNRDSLTSTSQILPGDSNSNNSRQTVNFMQRRLKQFKMVHSQTRESAQKQIYSGQQFLGINGQAQTDQRMHNMQQASSQTTGGQHYSVQGTTFQTPILTSTKMASENNSYQASKRQPMHNTQNQGTQVKNVITNDSHLGVAMYPKQQSTVLSSEKLKDLPNVQRFSQSNVPPKRQPNQYPKFTTNSVQSLNKLVDQAYGTKKLSPYYQMQPVKIGALPKLLEPNTPANDRQNQNSNRSVNSNKSNTKPSSQTQTSQNQDQENQNTQNQRQKSSSELTSIQQTSQNNQAQLNRTVYQQNISGLAKAYQPILQTSEYANAQSFPKRKMTFKLKNQGPNMTQNRRLANSNPANLTQSHTTAQSTMVNVTNVDEISSALQNNQSGIIVLPQVRSQNPNQLNVNQNNSGSGQGGQSSNFSLHPNQQNTQESPQLAPQLSPIKIQHKSFTMLKQKNLSSNKINTLSNNQQNNNTYMTGLQTSKDPVFNNDALGSFINKAQENQQKKQTNITGKMNESSKVAYGNLVNGGQNTNSSELKQTQEKSEVHNIQVIMSQQGSRLKQNPVQATPGILQNQLSAANTSFIMNQTAGIAMGGSLGMKGGAKASNNVTRSILSHQGRSETSWAAHTNNSTNPKGESGQAQQVNQINVMSNLQNKTIKGSDQANYSLSPIKINLAQVGTLGGTNRKPPNAYLPQRQSQGLNYVRRQKSPNSPKKQTQQNSKKDHLTQQHQAPKYMQYATPAGANSTSLGMGSQLTAGGQATSVGSQQMRMQRL